MATISVVSQTSSSATCQIVGIDTSRYFKIQWAILDEQNNATFGDISYLTGATHTNTFYNLSTGVQYLVACRLYFTDVDCDIVLGDYIILSGSSSSTYAITIQVNNYAYGEALAFESWAAPGTPVSVEATAYPGYRFAVWSSNPSVSFGDSFSASTYFIMPASNVTITANFIAGQARPNTFSWTNGTYNPYSGVVEKVKGDPFDLTATEWNGLCNNINAVRQYKGLQTYSFFPTASSGAVFYADMYNQAVYAIQGISGYGSALATVSAGSAITAYHMNILVSELNAIP